MGQATPVPFAGGPWPSKPRTRLRGPAVHGRTDKDRPSMDAVNCTSAAERSAYGRTLFFPAMNSRTLDRVMHLTWNRAVAADFTFDTPLNRLFEPSQEPNSSTGTVHY